MFNTEIINAIAATLNSRYYQSNLTALGVLSQLLVRRRTGSNYISRTELETLLHSSLENTFPLPQTRILVDGRNGYVVIDGHRFNVPEKEEAYTIGFFNSHAWNIVVADDQGGFQLVAAADRYQIPHGKSSIPFNLDALAGQMGSICADGYVMNSTAVTWVIRTWAQAGKILANDDMIYSSVFQRIHNQDVAIEQMELSSEAEMRSTFLNQDVAEELGLEQQPYPYSVHDVIEALVESGKVVEDLRSRVPVNQPDEETLAAALKIQGTIHFNDILTEVMALPIKKRTQKGINGIIVNKLGSRLADIKAMK